MKRTLRALEARKTELQARAEQERAQLALHFEPFEKFYRIRFRVDGELREMGPSG